MSTSTLEETNILWFQLSVTSKMEYLIVYLSVLWSCFYYQDNMNGKKFTHEGSQNKYWLKRHYHGCYPVWKLVWVIKTWFNFTLILSQISGFYFSLVYLHTYIYFTLAFFPLEAASTSSVADRTKLDYIRTRQISGPSFVI